MQQVPAKLCCAAGVHCELVCFACCDFVLGAWCCVLCSPCFVLHPANQFCSASPRLTLCASCVRGCTSDAICGCAEYCTVENCDQSCTLLTPVAGAPSMRAAPTPAPSWQGRTTWVAAQPPTATRLMSPGCRCGDLWRGPGCSGCPRPALGALHACGTYCRHGWHWLGHNHPQLLSSGMAWRRCHSMCGVKAKHALGDAWRVCGEVSLKCGGSVCRIGYLWPLWFLPAVPAVMAACSSELHMRAREPRAGHGLLGSSTAQLGLHATQ